MIICTVLRKYSNVSLAIGYSLIKLLINLPNNLSFIGRRFLFCLITILVLIIIWAISSSHIRIVEYYL